MIRLLKRDGWYLIATRGSHRQFKHPANRVTIAGKPRHDLSSSLGASRGGTLHSILKQAQLDQPAVNRFLIVVEEAEANFSVYSPDLPGCIASGKTREEAEKNMAEAIRLHIEGLIDDGQPVPKPSAFAEYVEI